MRKFPETRDRSREINVFIPNEKLSFQRGVGVVQRHVRDTSPPSVEYELTELGQELIPALDEIVKVGHKLKAKGHLPVKG